MLTDKAGKKLFRQVEIKVVFPEQIFAPRTFRSKAGPRQGFNAAGIADMQMQVADKLEELYPFWEFRVVELASRGRVARYVFTFAGYRAQQPAQIQSATMELPGLEEEKAK